MTNQNPGPHRVRRSSHAALVAGALLLAALWGGAAVAEVVAKVGGTEVTREELRSYVDTLPAPERAALAKDPALLGQVVRVHLGRRAVLQEARARKWDQDPAVKAQLDRVREEALVELYLQSVSRPPDGYPVEADLQAAYEANHGAFASPRQWRVAQLFFAAPRGDAAREVKASRRLEEARARLRQGVDFVAAAGDGDEKGAVQQGGESGWLTEEQLVPGIRATVAALAKGAVSEPIRLDDGWHVVKVVDVRPAGTRPLAEVREALAAELRAGRAQALRRAFLSRLLEQSPPVINELALAKILNKAQ